MNALNEDDVAAFIQGNPELFRRRPWLLASIELPDPHDGHAVSLAERQTQMLRERVRSLESRLADLARNGHDNDALARRLARWACTLLAERDEHLLPQRLIDELKELFSVPAAAVRLWQVDARFAGLECARSVAPDVVRFAASMQAPFCGLNADFAAAQWMQGDGTEIRSIALIPLRRQEDEAPSGAPFGLLVLGSGDAERFRGDMSTDFLDRLGQLAAAALGRLHA